MSNMRHWLAALVVLLIGAGGVVTGGQAPDPRTLGPKIGERVPDFSLPDQHGVTRPLMSMLGPKGAMLVFFRSADW